IYGNFSPLETHSDDIVAYARHTDNQRLISITNMSNTPLSYVIPVGEVLLNNYDSIDSNLKPYQTIIIKECVTNEQV
ncbi:MAG: hypothetical protein RSC68_20525, partial [Acinetobacter sp.]